MNELPVPRPSHFIASIAKVSGYARGQTFQHFNMAGFEA
jgi:hypothetical protein